MGELVLFPGVPAKVDIDPREGKLTQILQCPCGSISFMAYEGGPLQCTECNCFVQEYFCRKVSD